MRYSIITKTGERRIADKEAEEIKTQIKGHKKLITGRRIATRQREI